MTKWKTEKLSNLLTVSIGGIWGEEAGEAEVDVSVVRVTELKAHGRIDPSSAVTRSVTLKQLASRELQEGDLLLEKSGGGPNSPVGRVGYFFQEGTSTVCSNFMQLMRPDSSKVLPKYLFHFLDGFHSNGGTIPMQTATTNIRNIQTPQYMDIEVPVPPIDEQYKIVELLEDYLSRLDAALVDVLQAKLKAAQFKVAFLRNVFSGDSSWNSIPMKQLGKWGGGGTPSKANEKFWTNGTIPWLSPKDMGPLEIRQTVDKITEEACLNSTVKKIPENSVVFVVRSGILERKLPIALTKVETTLNQDMKALTFSDKVNPKFGFYYMLGFEQDILRTCRKSGTTVASINTESLMNYEIKIPSLPVQAEILDYVDSQLTLIDNSVPQVEFAIKVGNSLRRSLLQAAFTGQLTNEVVSV